MNDDMIDVPIVPPQFKVGADASGNCVLSFGEVGAVLPPGDALRVAAAICGLMSQHFMPPPPTIATPDRRLVLPNGAPAR